MVSREPSRDASESVLRQRRKPDENGGCETTCDGALRVTVALEQFSLLFENVARMCGVTIRVCRKRSTLIFVHLLDEIDSEPVTEKKGKRRLFGRPEWEARCLFAVRDEVLVWRGGEKVFSNGSLQGEGFNREVTFSVLLLLLPLFLSRKMTLPLYIQSLEWRCAEIITLTVSNRGASFFRLHSLSQAFPLKILCLAKNDN